VLSMTVHTSVWLNADPRGSRPYDDRQPSPDVYHDGTVSTNVRINDVRRAILSVMTRNPGVTARDLGAVTGLTERRVRANIKVLMDAGLITREGARKNGRWVVHAEVRDV